MSYFQRSGLAPRSRSRKFELLCIAATITFFSCFVSAAHRVKYTHGSLNSAVYISDVSDSIFSPREDLPDLKLFRRDSPGQTG
jgi:hypothetical protein